MGRNNKNNKKQQNKLVAWCTSDFCKWPPPRRKNLASQLRHHNWNFGSPPKCCILGLQRGMRKLFWGSGNMCQLILVASVWLYSFVKVHRTVHIKRTHFTECKLLSVNIFLNKFIHLFLAALGLHCCVWAFSSCGEWGLLFISVSGLLIAVASLVAEHGL